MTQRRILLVDDDPHVRRLIALYLRDLDAEIVEASNGEEALARIESERFDAALVDLILPYFGGFRLCRRLKETSPSTWVAIITADDSAETRETARESGANAFLGKPLDASEIRALVEKALDQSALS